MVELADIFRRYGPDYIDRFGSKMWTEIASNEDLYMNRASFEMSKSISEIKSLHDHIITIILTPANDECTLRKQYL
jgi:hypothetical protein